MTTQAPGPVDVGVQRLQRLAVVATVAVATSGVLAVLIAIARLGLPTPVRPLLAGIAVLAAAAYSPLLLPGRWHTGPFRSALVPVAALAVLISPVLALVVPSAVLFLAYVVVAGTGAARAWRWMRPVSRRRLALLMVTPVVLGLYIFGHVNHRENLHVYSAEYAALGIAHEDTLFHADIANMMKFQHVVSTGLDGRVPYRYHVGSHAWFAGFSDLGGQPMVTTMMVGLATVVIPGIFLFLFLAAVAVDTSNRCSVATIVLAGTGAVMVTDSLAPPAQYFSASHAFGIVVVLASVPLLALLMSERGAARGRAAAVRYGALLGLVALAGAVKISAALVLSVAVAYVIVRTRGLRAGVALAALLATVVLTAILFRDSTGVGRFALARLTFVRENPILTLAALVVPASLLGVLAAEHRRSEPLRTAFGAGRMLTAETILVVTLASLIPALFLSLAAEAAYYFFDVPMWLALPLLLARLPAADVRAFVHSVPTTASGVAVAVVAAVVLAAPILGVLNAPGRAAALTRPMLLALNAGSPAVRLPSSGGSFFLRSLRNDHRWFDRGFVAEVENTYGARAARRADAARRQYGEGLAVFVPQGNEQFWSPLGPCSARPFFFPAMAGVPLIQGLPPASRSCFTTSYYGYAQYDESSRSTELSDEEICQRARSRGFRSVLILAAGPPENAGVLGC